LSSDHCDGGEGTLQGTIRMALVRGDRHRIVKVGSGGYARALDGEGTQDRRAPKTELPCFGAGGVPMLDSVTGDGSVLVDVSGDEGAVIGLERKNGVCGGIDMANVGGFCLSNVGGGWDERVSAVYSILEGAPAQTPDGTLAAQSATPAQREESMTW
jgi:hypothetical protein